MSTENRRSGRSTRRVVSTVNTCLSNPGTWVTCIDHNDLVDSHRVMAQQVSAVLTTLNVPHDVEHEKVKVKRIKSRG